MSSKLHKREHSTDILLYHIYLPKLQENILKYYQLDLFKEITIGWILGFQMTLESFAFPTVFLLNVVIIFVFNLFSVLLRVLLVYRSTALRK